MMRFSRETGGAARIVDALGRLWGMFSEAAVRHAR
jgi:hypothetical protein